MKIKILKWNFFLINHFPSFDFKIFELKKKKIKMISGKASN